MFSERGDSGRLRRIGHVTPLGEIRRVGPCDLLSVLHSSEREIPPTVIQEKTDDATRLTLAMLLFVSRFIPAKRRSRFFNAPLRRVPGAVFALALMIHSGRWPPLAW
jgi:hypothetical protein